MSVGNAKMLNTDDDDQPMHGSCLWLVNLNFCANAPINRSWAGWDACPALSLPEYLCLKLQAVSVNVIPELFRLFKSLDFQCLAFGNIYGKAKQK